MNNRMKMRSAVAFVLVALFVLSSVAVLAPRIVYAPKTPTLGKTLCLTMGGTWAQKTKTCTVTSFTVTSSFGIPSRTTLAHVAGEGPMPVGGWTLAINAGVTITNYGVISNFATINNYGTIENYGTWMQCGVFNNYGTINYHEGGATPVCPPS